MSELQFNKKSKLIEAYSITHVIKRTWADSPFSETANIILINVPSFKTFDEAQIWLENNAEETKVYTINKIYQRIN